MMRAALNRCGLSGICLSGNGGETSELLDKVAIVRWMNANHGAVAG